MQKSWLALGSSVISLLAVVSFYLSTERQPTSTKFRVSWQPLLPAIAHNPLLTTDVDAAERRWALPSYQDYVAAQQARRAPITLQPADAEAYQKSLTDKSVTLSDLSDSNTSEQTPSVLITHVQERIFKGGDRKTELQQIQPILQSKGVSISFQPGGHIPIESSANQPHLTEQIWELYIDDATAELLLSFRRVVTEDLGINNEEVSTIDGLLGEDFPQYELEVAPGGGQYWIEDPNAAWW